MLIDAQSLPDGSVQQSDIAIIGAGAAGIVLALELGRAGFDVQLIESGGPTYSERIQALGKDEGSRMKDEDPIHPSSFILDPSSFPAAHPPMSECTRRQIGGTSAIWGGRVVPFDPVDFDDRPFLPNSRWPVTYESLVPYFDKACEYLRAGRPKFNIHSFSNVKCPSIVPGLPDGDVLSSTLERWSVVNLGKEYAADLRSSGRIKVLHGLTCTAIRAERENVRQGERERRDFSSSHALTFSRSFSVQGIEARTLAGKRLTIKAARYVLASGGLNTTRLLLASDDCCLGGIGNHSGLLGRFYTGHISGRIAEVHFSTSPRDTTFGFDRDDEGVYARRRFTFSREFLHAKRLANIAAWLVNPEISDPAHGNGVLSFAYLALSSPFGKYLASEAIRKSAIAGDVHGRTRSHMLNMLRDLPRTALFIPTFGYGRYFARRKIPGFFQYSRSNVYTLHYSAEQAPNPDSRVTLSKTTDELGLRRIRIEHRYTDQDVRGIIDSHRYWDDYLRLHSRGRLKYVVNDLESSIRRQAGDGYHQIGTTRMSESPADGVVGPDCNVHGFDDLFIASSSTFVTASQANSMFMILVLALRLADHLKRPLVR
jgi:hypothetical protein